MKITAKKGTINAIASFDHAQNQRHTVNLPICDRLLYLKVHRKFIKYVFGFSLVVL